MDSCEENYSCNFGDQIEVCRTTSRDQKRYGEICTDHDDPTNHSQDVEDRFAKGGEEIHEKNIARI